ncbi:right-handed parallel beta-helix repeat-containing protein [Opitutus sp. GAS368]|jgi:hypothetical protein|uniref:right-handed parallel beta-helix repeat-containing protein n=1 Tax=Opitutus sp. GAS368 TaxID=1882749 RepID=UPI00087D483C|nr:right-handed parallel beta-helix repeat-containing protein [Opitutus sp. GAS368]SDS19086.1 Right handed beta helix region [Opitutus sp. GAS368]
MKPLPRQSILALLLAGLAVQPGLARDLHVSASSSEAANGSVARPYHTISAAAQVAVPGDTVIVHEGTYRERITPPRGGDSEERRIVYQAAPGEKVTIKGSEVIKGWKPFSDNVWQVTLPNGFFGSYNPYQDLVQGDWFEAKGRPHHTGEVYLNGKSLYEVPLLPKVLDPQSFPDSRDREASTWTWFCESDDRSTHIYANFHGKNPNDELVEINVRDSCFYPATTGCDYITVRGFRLTQAATQWAAPTAEQIGLIGTNWSKGWIIEDNVISDSKCAGITLGKDRASGQNVWSADPTRDGALHYNELIERVLKAGWSREQVGSHVVRRNTIFNCEQAGICGSLGAIFSEITDNHVYNIWVKRQFAGEEIAGIKLHAAIDVLIKGNRVHHAGRGIWLDWMAQGTRVSANLCYDNDRDDLFMEVNHGPFVVDNNLFLSGLSLRDWSEGGAYVHNLFGGRIENRAEPNRATPYHAAHSTAVMGVRLIEGGDNRFYNNLFCGGDEPSTLPESINDEVPRRIFGYGLWMYDHAANPVKAGGNIYLRGARPAVVDATSLVFTGAGPAWRFEDLGQSGHLILSLPTEASGSQVPLIATTGLGKTKISGLPFESPTGKPLVVDSDYFGKKRDSRNAGVGPFADPASSQRRIKLW